MIDFRRKTGLTLTEVTIASLIAVMVIAGVMTLYIFMQSTWKKVRIKSHIIGQLETSLELMKRELQQTDANQIMGYVAPLSTVISAISFPLPVDSDADGFVELTDSTPPRIAWGETVIYHTYTDPVTQKIELRRTLFSPRDTGMSNADRQTQLSDVVNNGSPTIAPGAPGYEPWSAAAGTRALCVNDNVALTITPAVALFDGYSASPTPDRSENVTFGSTTLTAGAHTITFTCNDINPSSAGYGIGIDCFSITPGGFVREAEEAAVGGVGSAAVPLNEDMSAYPNWSWSGNRQLEYPAIGVNDFVTLNFDYDQYRDTNFSSPLAKSNVTVEYGSRTGGGTDGRELSGNSDYAARLGGCEDAWSALEQTEAAGITPQTIDVSGTDGIYIRNIISGDRLTSEGRSIKIRFDNTQNTQPLVIEDANIMERENGSDGKTSGASFPVTDITFYDEGGGIGITIPAGAGGTRESDWIDINNFDKSKDYLLTLHALLGQGSHVISGWAAGDGSDQSYLLENSADVAKTPVWSVYGSGVRSMPVTYITESIDVSYFSTGTFTSQVYDTGVDNPLYSTLTWNIAANNYGNFGIGGLGADLMIKVRSGASDTALLQSSDWTGAVTAYTLSQTTGSENIGTLGGGNNKYFQFQLQFDSKPTDGKSDYIRSCILKDLTISWPGQSRVVDVSGYFTQKSDYGIFFVRVDGNDLVRGIYARLAVSEKFSGDEYTEKYLTVEIQPRNK